ncbi:hypothetical protein SAMN06297358_2106 [Pedobacter xixiisoli]|uniref:Uncharacterized protein n=1 Tax=Pedobacter xixiisoli TaxID=1476464 RepID=A0A285ZZV5_9SPHI|nr:hypothetical protein SAMN06297358_2106 [Pedobacter xixiisoli]
MTGKGKGKGSAGIPPPTPSKGGHGQCKVELTLLNTKDGLSLSPFKEFNKSSVKNKKLFERSEFFLFSGTFEFLGEKVQP